MRLILDTNVVISGLLWRGPSARLIDLAIEQVVTICVNPFLADELAEKLAMPKFASRIAAGGSTPERSTPETLCEQYLALCERVPALTIAHTCRDADDDNVLAAALSARADLIVSGDGDLRILRVFEGVSIVNAVDALTMPSQRS